MRQATTLPHCSFLSYLYLPPPKNSASPSISTSIPDTMIPIATKMSPEAMLIRLHTNDTNDTNDTDVHHRGHKYLL